MLSVDLAGHMAKTKDEKARLVNQKTSLTDY